MQRRIGYIFLFGLAATLAVLLGYRYAVVTHAAPADPWQLVDGQVYEVADFRACARDGVTFTEWHFGGKDRSVQNHQTPLVDRFGQRWLEVVIGDKALPPGHMRVVKVLDPYADGRRFGNREVYIAQYNGRVEPQVRLGPCGPSR